MSRIRVRSKSVMGIVQWFDSIRGIGFIRSEQGNMVFVNYTDLPIKNGNFIVLRSNQKVLFDIAIGNRGPQAKNIRIVS